MSGFELSRLARRDIVGILQFSENRYGERAARAYETLLLRALSTIRTDPMTRASKPVPEMRAGIRQFHLRSVPQPSPKAVARPRHTVIFEIDAKGVTVLRILHERMDKKRHLR